MPTNKKATNKTSVSVKKQAVDAPKMPAKKQAVNRVQPPKQRAAKSAQIKPAAKKTTKIIVPTARLHKERGPKTVIGTVSIDQKNKCTCGYSCAS
jgi:hypothetical protein